MVNEIKIQEFKIDEAANDAFEMFDFPTEYHGNQVVDGGVEFSCKANGFAKPFIYINVIF